jgi:NitT/TauT family transport system permease protein
VDEPVPGGERRGRTAGDFLWPTLTGVALLLAWETAVASLGIRPIVLPPPSRVAVALVTRRALLLQHLWPTLWQCLAGFLLAALGGTLLGVAVSLSTAFRKAIYPHLVAFQVLPKVTVAPLFILWWGVGGTSRVLLAFFICFFPMVVNTLTGLASADADMVRMARAFTASPRQVFWRVRLPAALPSIFAGLKISATFAVIGIIVAEFVSSQEGLGYLMIFAQGLLDTATMLAAIVVLSLMGLALYGGVCLLERACIYWQEPT